MTLHGANAATHTVRGQPVFLARIRPFIPPVYVDQFNFPEFRMEIVAPHSYLPRKDYNDCTEKYQAQVRLTSDGAAANYVCGQPALLPPLQFSGCVDGCRNQG